MFTRVNAIELMSTDDVAQFVGSIFGRHQTASFEADDGSKVILDRKKFSDEMTRARTSNTPVTEDFINQACLKSVINPEKDKGKDKDTSDEEVELHSEEESEDIEVDPDFFKEIAQKTFKKIQKQMVAEYFYLEFPRELAAELERNYDSIMEHIPEDEYINNHLEGLLGKTDEELDEAIKELVGEDNFDKDDPTSLVDGLFTEAKRRQNLIIAQAKLKHLISLCGADNPTVLGQLRNPDNLVGILSKLKDYSEEDITADFQALINQEISKEHISHLMDQFGLNTSPVYVNAIFGENQYNRVSLVFADTPLGNLMGAQKDSIKRALGAIDTADEIDTLLNDPAIDRNKLPIDRLGLNEASRNVLFGEIQYHGLMREREYVGTPFAAAISESPEVITRVKAFLGAKTDRDVIKQMVTASLNLNTDKNALTNFGWTDAGKNRVFGDNQFRRLVEAHAGKGFLVTALDRNKVAVEAALGASANKIDVDTKITNLLNQALDKGALDAPMQALGLDPNIIADKNAIFGENQYNRLITDNAGRPAFLAALGRNPDAAKGVLGAIPDKASIDRFVALVVNPETNKDGFPLVFNDEADKVAIFAENQRMNLLTKPKYAALAAVMSADPAVQNAVTTKLGEYNSRAQVEGFANAVINPETDKANLPIADLGFADTSAIRNAIHGENQYARLLKDYVYYPFLITALSTPPNTAQMKIKLGETATKDAANLLVKAVINPTLNKNALDVPMQNLGLNPDVALNPNFLADKNAVFGENQFNRILDDENVSNTLKDVLEANASAVEARLGALETLAEVDTLINLVKQASNETELDDALDDLSIDKTAMDPDNYKHLLAEGQYYQFLNRPDVSEMPALLGLLNDPAIKGALIHNGVLGAALPNRAEIERLNKMLSDPAQVTNAETARDALSMALGVDKDLIRDAGIDVPDSENTLRGQARFQLLNADANSLGMGILQNIAAGAKAELSAHWGSVAQVQPDSAALLQLREEILTTPDLADLRTKIKTTLCGTAPIPVPDALNTALDNALNTHLNSQVQVDALHKQAVKGISKTKSEASNTLSVNLYQSVKALAQIMSDMHSGRKFIKWDDTNTISKMIERVQKELTAGYIRKDSELYQELKDLHSALRAMEKGITNLEAKPTIGKGNVTGTHIEKYLNMELNKLKMADATFNKSLNRFAENANNIAKAKPGENYADKKSLVDDRNILANYEWQAKKYYDEAQRRMGSISPQDIKFRDEIEKSCYLLLDNLQLARGKLMSEGKLELLPSIDLCQKKLNKTITNLEAATTLGPVTKVNCFSDKFEVFEKNDLAFQTKFDEYVALCNIAGVGGEPGRLSAGSRGIEKSDRFEDKKRVTLNKLETSEKDITGFVTVQETKNGVYQSEIHHEAGLMKDLPFDQLVKAAARIVEDFYSGLADKKTKMVIHAGVDPKLAEAIRMYTAVKEYRPPISHAASVEKSFFSKVGNSFDEDRELKKFGKVLFEKRTDIFPYSPQLGINKFCDVQADLNEVRKQTRTPTK